MTAAEKGEGRTGAGAASDVAAEGRAEAATRDELCEAVKCVATSNMETFMRVVASRIIYTSQGVAASCSVAAICTAT